MIVMFEDFRRGWTDGRSGEVNPARRPQSPAGDGAKEDNSLAEITALAEQLQARVDELEAGGAEVTVLAGVLRLPGVKTWLLSRFHPDKHTDANETERKALTDASQMINAAYEFVERRNEHNSG
jgi:hypothetical protein